ncbi:hypothetical protein F750_6376 [Streptomyces sp. PAMC 26508]|nr:hypothetical protein F750_6376 [Streptomyces sp. PAMC 26508]
MRYVHRVMFEECMHDGVPPGAPETGASVRVRERGPEGTSARPLVDVSRRVRAGGAGEPGAGSAQQRNT